MSRNPSPRSAWSWLNAVTGWFSAETEKAKPAGRYHLHGRSLQLEPLENRSLLSVSMPAMISGVAFYDPTGSGLTASDTRLSGVTVKLFRDGGNGVFDGGAFRRRRHFGRHHHHQCVRQLSVHQSVGRNLFRRADAGHRLCASDGKERRHSDHRR